MWPPPLGDVGTELSGVIVRDSEGIELGDSSPVLLLCVRIEIQLSQV